jgi:hypothetical protein
MAKAEGDGQTVNIPSLRLIIDGVTDDKTGSALMVLCWLQKDEHGRQIRRAAFSGERRAQSKGHGFPWSISRKSIPRKPSKSYIKRIRTVNRHRWARRVASGERVNLR